MTIFTPPPIASSHVTLESTAAPAITLASDLNEQKLIASHQNSELFLFAAPTISELIQAIDQLRHQAQGISDTELCDLAAHINRLVVSTESSIRASIVAESPADLLSHLTLVTQALTQNPPATGSHVQIQIGIYIANAAPAPRLGFLFPGQGSQQLNMALQFVNRYSWAKELVETADHYLVEKGFSAISPLIFRPLDQALGIELAENWKQQLTDTRHAQIAICLASLIHTEFLRRLGLQPSVVAGHSLGELSALATAGAMNHQTLLRLAAERGQTMSALHENAGSMARFICSESEAEKIVAEVPSYLTIACINSPSQIVLAGEKQAIDAALEISRSRGIKSKLLPVSNAFHSRLINHASLHLESLEWLSQMAPLSTPVVSALNGTVMTESIDLSAYCAAQVVAPVRFVDVAHKISDYCDLLIEVGPGRVLTSLTAEIKGSDPQSNLPLCFPIESRPGADRDFNRLIGMLFARGCILNTTILYEERLIRPFLPVSQQQFIDNLCERPFPEALESQVHTQPFSYSDKQYHSVHTLLEAIKLPGISDQELSDYLKYRSRFIAQVIRADMESLTEVTRDTVTSVTSLD